MGASPCPARHLLRGVPRMTNPWIAALSAIFLWWFSTGIIMWRVKRTDMEGRDAHLWSVMLGLPLLLGGVAGIVETLDDTTAMGSWIGFVSALAIWGWVELAFLSGIVAGPNTAACPPYAPLWERFFRAVGTILWHELALMGTLGVIAVISEGAANRFALWTFAILFFARISAKLNLFFGVPRIHTEFLPRPLSHLPSHFRLAPMNWVFPISVSALSFASACWLERVWTATTEGALIGFTLLAALLLARLCGVEDQIEISPLFETAEALERRGERVIEEALRSPHFRAHLRRRGRLFLQFGYSDSGRYVGQIAASHLIERLKLRVAELLTRQGMGDLEVVLFDTHGEGLGRGGHPDGLAARLAYLDPPAVRAAFEERGIALRHESSFQGSDGYLTFGTLALAHAAVARLAEHAFAGTADARADPVYAEGDYVADLFAGMRAAMAGLVEDAGYAALLGGFGPALLDATGSRPAARQGDAGGPAVIRHPRELRAIPNNAVLQQLGFLANLTHGLGRVAPREPDTLADLMARSPRFAGAMAFARAGLALGDPEVLRGYVATLDPGSWLDRAAATQRPGRAAALTAVAHALEEQGLGDAVRRVFRRLVEDDLALRRAWPGGAPRMSDRLFAVHALRLALVHRIWLVAVTIPDFSPRHGVTRAALVRRLLRLDVAAACALLDKVFPAPGSAGPELDYGEPPSPRHPGYGRERAEVIDRLRDLFALVREASSVISLECGAHG